MGYEPESIEKIREEFVTSPNAVCGRLDIIHAAELMVTLVISQKIYTGNELTRPGWTTGPAGVNSITARNLAYVVRDYAVREGFNVDTKRWTVHYDDSHTGEMLCSYVLTLAWLDSLGVPVPVNASKT